MTTRREFAAQALAASAAARLPRFADRLGAIGIQLYTVRDVLPKRFEGTLAALATAGYREVEFAGYHDVAPAEVRRILDRHGLVAPAAHVELDDLRSRWPATLESAKTVGHSYLVLAWLDVADRKTIDQYRAVADLLNRAAAQAKAVGIEVAYHNHDFEFAPIAGSVPYDVLLASTDRTLVTFELDLYWATKGGVDPVALFAASPGRFPLVHVKDMSRDASREMVELGQGRVDFKRIFAQSKQAGIKHYFVEHDQPRDSMAFAQRAAAYLKGLEF